MSVRTQTSLDRLFEPGVIILGYYQPGSEDWNRLGPVVLAETYAGAVLDTYERNGYDDSDFFAIVWDEQTQTIKTVEYATTRGWTYANSANVDATAEVTAKAKAARVKSLSQQLRLNSESEAKIIKRGSICRVVKGRKIPVGELVTILGEPRQDQWGKTNALVRCEDGSTVRTNVENLEVANPQALYASLDDCEKRATEIVYSQNLNWRSLLWAGIPANLINRIFSR